MAGFFYAVIIFCMSASAVRSIYGLVRDIKEVKEKKEARERVYAFLEKVVISNEKQESAA